MRALLFMAYIKGEAVTQGSLFPVSLDELIPEDHLVRVVAAYVDRLPLEMLGFAKAVAKATGRPPLILPIYSSCICTAICTAYAHRDVWNPNVSAMWK